MRDRNAPLTAGDLASLDWDKGGGLLPAIVQDRRSGRVLMLGYMNQDAAEATMQTGLVTFFSRSKQRSWQKGETSGNVLHASGVFADCDDDTLLVLAKPEGPTCHTGTLSCFGDEATAGPGWLADLATIIGERAVSGDESSYTRRLLAEGVQRIAQKVGEEGVEVALAAVSREPAGVADEIADLLYHVSVLMQALELDWDEVMTVLRSRHSAKPLRA
jgi:phosphoribosyl-ATP pyrophosphohydrolase/phosphoribosyl-AMP cyclohydrolase